ncbi:tRNA pseudouridine(38-40) synthase TruA [Paludibacter sp.]|uniref:tRNA pseudouridine(38-40) synthase TruA n=1 Tax=Paludibacter sp. TaxID=1898105 RepID=UPI0013546552|nr:tRNA pseudouridine(38-40) synthase TruA [Paludibacter sp.]MTK52544.1 tRNA pseudouridine(38-40) synthase TruA [Paludibacter sp.]
MKRRYFIWLSYNGTHYHGWQIQPNGVSVQQKLQDAISLLMRVHTDVIGAGRTDAGVHARTMVAHFDAEEIEQPELFLKKLNGVLPNDIAVWDLKKVKSGAHARFDAINRTYEYWVTPEKNPFHLESAARVHSPLDFEAMNQAAAILPEYIDFTSFSKLHTDVKTNNCTITQAYWAKRGDIWVFTITANRFLRNMVRAIVGTLLKVGRGQLSENDFRAIIEAKDRGKAGSSAYAHGLYLTDVAYPDSIFESDECAQ